MPNLFGRHAAKQTRTKRGKSLRQVLLDQGVPEKDLQTHLAFVSRCLIANPKLEVLRYRVNPSDTSQPYMG